jgi:hypothetical protein
MDMAWMVALLAVFVYLGLRDRIWGGSTHLTVIVVTGVALSYLLFFRLGR